MVITICHLLLLHIVVFVCYTYLDLGKPGELVAYSAYSTLDALRNSLQHLKCVFFSFSFLFFLSKILIFTQHKKCHMYREKIQFEIVIQIALTTFIHSLCCGICSMSTGSPVCLNECPALLSEYIAHKGNSSLFQTQMLLHRPLNGEYSVHFYVFHCL